MNLTNDQRQLIYNLSERFLRDEKEEDELEWLEPTFNMMEDKGLLDGRPLSLPRNQFLDADSGVGIEDPVLSQLVLMLIGAAIYDISKYGLKVIESPEERERLKKRIVKIKSIPKKVDDITKKILEWLDKIGLDPDSLPKDRVNKEKEDGNSDENIAEPDTDLGDVNVEDDQSSNTDAESNR